MNKQKKHTILNVIITISVIMLMLIICFIVYEHLINQKDINELNTNNEIENTIKEDNNTEKQEEKMSEEENEEEYIGQEEKESETNDKDEKSIDKKALDLAKKEWGEDSSVQFSIEEKKTNKYYIAVTSNATRIAWYEVNIDTWEISEFY